MHYVALQYYNFFAFVSSFTLPGADTGFPVGGDVNPWGGGPPTYKFARLSQKLHEIKKNLVRGGVSPLNPSLTTAKEFGVTLTPVKNPCYSYGNFNCSNGWF